MAKKDGRDPYKTPSRSWFIVFNNPENHGYSGEPEGILNQLREAIQTISKPPEQLAIQMPEGGELPF